MYRHRIGDKEDVIGKHRASLLQLRRRSFSYFSGRIAWAVRYQSRRRSRMYGVWTEIPVNRDSALDYINRLDAKGLSGCGESCGSASDNQEKQRETDGNWD